MDNVSDNAASESPAADSSATSETVSPELAAIPPTEPPTEPPITGKALRAGFWENVFGTYSHINAALKVESKRLRADDYISVILLPVSAIALAWCCASPTGISIRPYLVLTFNLASLYFIFARVGIIRTLNTRQTHLVWVIICATFILGCVFALLLYDFIRMLEAPLLR